MSIPAGRANGLLRRATKTIRTSTVPSPIRLLDFGAVVVRHAREVRGVYV